jgi:proteasome accessory factor C
MTESAEGRLGRRLRRILAVLPYAIRHPGVSVDELSRKFSVAKKDLIADLNLLFLCGLPGYGPGDLIDVTMEEDRVYVRMADYFSAPLRLTPAEALGIHAQASALAALPEMGEAESLRSALMKLGRAIGMDDESADAPAIEMRLQPGPGAHLAAVRSALEKERRLRLEYFSATRGQLTEREVDPWTVIIAGGHSYLVAWDHLTGDERMFRIDRIKAVDVLDEEAEVPADFDPSRYMQAFIERPGQRRVTMEISPQAARWFEDYIPTRASRGLRGGWRAVDIVADSDRWVATLLLRLGGQVRKVEPATAMDEARRLARTIADAHDHA